MRPVVHSAWQYSRSYLGFSDMSDKEYLLSLQMVNNASPGSVSENYDLYTNT